MSIEDDPVPLLIDTKAQSQSDAPTDPTTGLVPVTVVTGYLGSGKSTLLKYITTMRTGKRIAIILNEFGETADIERSLTVSEESTEVEEWLELDNGCMCCTAKDAGVSAIEKLMERKGRFDYVLLETSGLADPAPIANMFWLDDSLMSNLKLDGVVTVVDAKNIRQSLDEGPTASVQIAGADMVIINKCDTCTEEEIKATEQRISQINGACEIIKCQFGEVDPARILDLHAYENSLSIPADCSSSSEKKVGRHHDHHVSTIVIPLSNGNESLSSADVARIESRLQTLLWEKDVEGDRVDVYRAKGRVVTPNETLIIQGVRETYEFIPVPSGSGQPSSSDTSKSPESNAQQLSSKLVLIGRGLEAAKNALLTYFR